MLRRMGTAIKDRSTNQSPVPFPPRPPSPRLHLLVPLRLLPHISNHGLVKVPAKEFIRGAVGITDEALGHISPSEEMIFGEENNFEGILREL